MDICTCTHAATQSYVVSCRYNRYIYWISFSICRIGKNISEIVEIFIFFFQLWVSEEVTAQLYSPHCYRVRWLFMWMSELHFISVIYARDVQYNLRDKLPSTNLQILRVTSWQCAAETGARRRAQEIRDKCDRGRLFVWNMTVMTRDGTKLRLWRSDTLHIALTRKCKLHLHRR